MMRMQGNRPRAGLEYPHYKTVAIPGKAYAAQACAAAVFKEEAAPCPIARADRGCGARVARACHWPQHPAKAQHAGL